MILSPEMEEKYRNDPRSDRELIDLVLTKDMDADGEAFWDPMRLLQFRLPGIIKGVEKLVKSDNAKARESAATILGQNLMREKWNASRCADLLVELLAEETAPGALVSSLHALGHLHKPKSIPTILKFEENADAGVRYAVTFALGGFEDENAIAALVKLSADADDDVRNWSTFNLGSMIDVDTPAIREALAARLVDSDDESKAEAILGLSRRGDVRAVPFMLEFFDRLSENESGRELFNENLVIHGRALMEDAVEDAADAVMRVADVRWKPVLLRAQTLEIGDSQKIQSAIEHCASLR